MLRIDDLQNKSVLVTGASGGIGAVVAHAFALQGARAVLGLVAMGIWSGWHRVIASPVAIYRSSRSHRWR
jgi:NAD(P)-dependent dehydrogenase (short-subunit alcohol dehydrogenase family)